MAACARECLREAEACNSRPSVGRSPESGGRNSLPLKRMSCKHRPAQLGLAPLIPMLLTSKAFECLVVQSSGTRLERFVMRGPAFGVGAHIGGRSLTISGRRGDLET